jgi:hypothetical protein
VTLSKQLINLLGIVLVLAIVVAGVAVLALPLYSQAKTTDLAVADVTQTNDVYALQVQQLKADEARIDEISASVALLRSEITALPQLDDVHALVESAASESEATVVSVIAADPVPWLPRTVVSFSYGDAAAAPEAAAPEGAAPVAPESTDGDTTEGEQADSSGAETGEGTAEGGGEPTEVVPPQQQVPIVITVEVADAAAAAAFIDALDAGPRLLGIESAVLSDEDDVLQLVVNALAFTRIED